MLFVTKAQKSALIDQNVKNPAGRSNIEIMTYGLPPMLNNGTNVEQHHGTHKYPMKKLKSIKMLFQNCKIALAKKSKRLTLNNTMNI